MSLAHIDFSMPVPIALAFASAGLFPIWLAVSARFAFLARRHALRFLVSASITLATWAIITAVIGSAFTSFGDLVAGLCLILGALLFYLEVWGLLTRGYTLGILLTLVKAAHPMTAQEIFDGYRDGEGLSWIMRHRIGGLCATGLIERFGDRLTLTSGRGVWIARLQKLGVTVLGLKRTG